MAQLKNTKVDGTLQVSGISSVNGGGGLRFLKDTNPNDWLLKIEKDSTYNRVAISFEHDNYLPSGRHDGLVIYASGNATNSNFYGDSVRNVLQLKYTDNTEAINFYNTTPQLNKYIEFKSQAIFTLGNQYGPFVGNGYNIFPLYSPYVLPLCETSVVEIYNRSDKSNIGYQFNTYAVGNRIYNDGNIYLYDYEGYISVTTKTANSILYRLRSTYEQFRIAWSGTLSEATRVGKIAIYSAVLMTNSLIKIKFKLETCLSDGGIHTLFNPIKISIPELFKTISLAAYDYD